MSRRNNKHRTRSFLILVAVVLISGLALWQTGNLTRPFEYSRVMLQAADMPDPAEASPEEIGFTMVSLDDVDAANTVEDRPAPPDGDERGGHDGEAVTGWRQYVNFSWRNAGGVFYNLWMIMALTIGVIVLARPIGWIVKFAKKITVQRPMPNAVSTPSS